MQDNFDLKGYLRHGNKLLNEGIGGYFDLRPINKLNEDDDEDYYDDPYDDERNDFPFDSNKDDDYDKDNDELVGEEETGDIVTIDLDMAWDSSNPEEDAAAKAAFDQYGIEVSDETGRPGTYEVTGRKEDILAYLRSEFYGMDEEAIKQYYPELLDGEMTELEKPEKIYADDDSDEFGSYQDRIMGLGGDRIESGIISLLDDGFEAEDVMDFCKMIIDAHSQAAAQGQKF